MKQPFISVIVPVYNIMEYLPRCVHSILAQTYQDLEVILVDDGSTDGTGQLCEELAKEDSRIRVFHKENGGSSSARNLGIRESKGEYLGFVDSDDYISPKMYETLVAGLESSGNHDPRNMISQVGRWEIDENGSELPDVCIPPDEKQVFSSEEFLKELFMYRGDCSFCTKLVPKEFFKEECFPEGVLNEDFYLIVKFLAKGAGIVSLPERGYYVFYRQGSNTRKKEKDNFSRAFGDGVRNADMILSLAKESYPKLLKEAYRFGVIQRLDYLLHIPISQMNKKNSQYIDIRKWMRRNWWIGIQNPYLTKKNKCYHTLFAIAPKGIRIWHQKILLIKKR